MPDQAQTKGEIIIAGIDKIREGLEMISKLGSKEDLVKTLVGSKTAADRLKDLMKNNAIFQNLVVSMVASRNSRLVPGTVESIINDFMDILFDLSRPYKEEIKPVAQTGK